jgi:predicted Zn-dependent protease
MGHSLGLGHNSNPQSIMYPETNLITTPSVDDENALAQVCAKRSIFVLASQKLILFLGSLHQSLNNLIVQYQQ